MYFFKWPKKKKVHVHTLCVISLPKIDGNNSEDIADITMKLDLIVLMSTVKGLKTGETKELIFFFFQNSIIQNTYSFCHGSAYGRQKKEQRRKFKEYHSAGHWNISLKKATNKYQTEFSILS